MKLCLGNIPIGSLNIRKQDVDSDVCTTVLPKKNCANANWSGQAFLATVPANITETSDGITLKKLYVHDTKIVGYASNNMSPRNDIVLRAVYEF